MLSLSEKVEDYAAEVAGMLKREGFARRPIVRNEKLGFKVREAELAKVPYMVVVGEREAAARQVSLAIVARREEPDDGVGSANEMLKVEPHRRDRRDLLLPTVLRYTEKNVNAEDGEPGQILRI